MYVDLLHAFMLCAMRLDRHTLAAGNPVCAQVQKIWSANLRDDTKAWHVVICRFIGLSLRSTIHCVHSIVKIYTLLPLLCIAVAILAFSYMVSATSRRVLEACSTYVFC